MNAERTLPTGNIFYRWLVHDHMGAAQDEEDQVKRLLREEAEYHEAITEELLLDIYDTEDDLSTLDLRHGISNRLQTILEEHQEEEDAS